MQRPLIRPCAYSILILLFTIITTAVFISPLLLFHYSYCHKTVTTDKLLRASLFPGAAELTTPLLRLTSILCLPLCRINKLGNTSLEDCCDPLYLWVISRRRESHLGGFRRSPPAPCRRGDSSPGGLYTAMVALGVMSE